MAKRKGIEKPYNNHTWTKSRYMSQIRSHLRNAFRYWLPIKEAKLGARRKSQSDNKRLKWESQCEKCKAWFTEKETQVDHAIPCGQLRELWDIPLFVEKLSAEGDGYDVLCKDCHKEVTAEERAYYKSDEYITEYYVERIDYYKKVVNKLESELEKQLNK